MVVSIFWHSKLNAIRWKLQLCNLCILIEPLLEYILYKPDVPAYPNLGNLHI